MPSISLRSADPVADFDARPIQVGAVQIGAAQRPPASPAYQIGVVADRAGFDALQPEWTALTGRAATPVQVFQTFNWAWHWCNHYLPADGSTRLAIVTVRRHGELVALWPLVRRRRLGITRLAWIGDPVSQYGDVIVADVADAAEVLARSWAYVCCALGADLVVLRKVRADSAVAALLATAGQAPSCSDAAPYLDLTTAADFAAFGQRWTGKARKNRRRLRRRLEEQGTVAVEHHARGPVAAPLIARAMALKRAWLAAKGLLSRAFADARFDRFLIDAVTSSTHPVAGFASALSSNGVMANIAIGFDCDGRRAMYMIAYDAALEQHGVGTLHMEDCIRQAFADKIEIFDLLGPKSDYKMDWCEAAMPVYDYRIALTLRSRIYGAARTGLAAAFASDLGRRLPYRLRTGLVSALDRSRDLPA